jgi:hypothetical protein
MAKKSQEGLDRAERFQVRMPVLYRVPDSPEWHETQTENVSHTGVLFQTKSVLKPSTIVDVRLEVPPTNGVNGHAEVVCKCEVVRVEKEHGKAKSPVLGFAIRNYRFTRKEEPN